MGGKIFYYNCVAVDIFLEVLQDFLYVFWCSYVGFTYTYNFYVLMDCSLEFYEVSFWIAFMALVLKSVLSHVSNATLAFFFPVHLLGIFVSSPSLSVCVGLLF